MKIRNFLPNAIFLTFYVIITLAIRSQGYFTATLLHKDLVYFSLWIPIAVIYLLFTIFYVYNKESKVKSLVSIFTAICISVVGILIPTIYMTLSLYLQLIVFIILYLMILGSVGTEYYTKRKFRAKA